MKADRDLERRLIGYYAAEAPSRAPDRVLEAVLERVDGERHRRPAIRVPWGFPGMRGRTARVVVVLLAALLLAAAGLMVIGSRPIPRVPEPLTWSPERYAQDWPAPPRTEPISGAPDVLLVRGEDTHWDPGERAWEGLEHVDAVGDAGPGAIPAVDIHKAGGPGAGLASYSMRLAGGVPLPKTDPATRWIAYGLVIDADGDGIGDARVGTDNMPDGSHRAWSTDLATGRTMWKAGPPYGSVYDDGEVGTGSLGLDTWYPSVGEGIDHPWIRYSGPTGRHYAWASMIVGGQVVATDYAPDVGWLVTPEDPGLPLIGTRWVLGREFPSASLWVEMWLIFAADGRLLLELCDQGQAAVQVTPDTMRVTDIIRGPDTCGAEVTEMESEFLRVLTADEISYTLDAGVLELRAGDDVLRLEGSVEPAPG